MEPAHHHATVAENDCVAQPQMRLDIGQLQNDGGVPEEELHQQRRVANDVDIGAGEIAHHPVGGEARNAHDQSQNCCEHNPRHHHAQRVDDAHDERTSVALLRVKGRPFGNAETGRLGEEIPAQRNVAAAQIGDDIACKEGHRHHQQRDHSRLHQQVDDTRILED